MGIVIALPFVCYFLSKAKVLVPPEKSEADMSPLGVLGIVMAAVLIPPLLGETIAVIAGIIMYPEFLIQTLFRGLRFYMIAFGSVSICYLAIVLHNRKKRKAREVSEDLS